MTERFQLILKAKNITASKFADEIGAQRSSVSHILTGRNNPSLDIILKVLKKYPDINVEWLISGKGPMSVQYPQSDFFDDDKPVESNIPEQKPNQYDLFNSDTPKHKQNNSETTVNIASKHFMDDSKNDKNNFEKNNKADNNIMQSKAENKILQLEDEEQCSYQKPNNINPKQTETISELIQSGKKIDKIVIFYSDKTFSWYNPAE
jgi:transcriptional regulator with XRE-family HTH domain